MMVPVPFRKMLDTAYRLPLWTPAVLLSCSGVAAAADKAGLFSGTTWSAALSFAAGIAILVWCYRAIRGAKKHSEHQESLIWRALAENIADLVLLLTRDGKVLYASRWNKDPESIIGAPVLNLVHESDKKRWSEFVAGIIFKQSACSTASFRMSLPDGRTSFWELKIATLDSEGFGAEYILCCRDITNSHTEDLAKDVLHKISLESSRVESLPVFIDHIEQQLSRIVDTSHFYLALYDKESDTYSEYLRKENSGKCEVSRGSIDLKGGLTDYVRKIGLPLLMNEENREHLKESVGLRSIGDSAACWLGVPLQVQSDVLGVLAVQSYDDPLHFKQSDLDLLSIVAGSIGRALERQQAQTALRNREAKLKMFTERMPALLWSQNSEGKITYAAGAALAALGIQPENLISRFFNDVVETINDPHLGEPANNKSDSTLRFKLRNRIFEAFLEPAYGPDGALTEVIGAAMDVTESDRVGKELKRFFDLTADAFLVMNMKGEAVRFNQAFLNIGGYTAEERMGASSFSLVHPEDRHFAGEALITLGMGEPVIGHEVRQLAKNGTYKWVSWNAAAGDDGLIYCSGKDVTHRREMENRMRERELQMRLFVQHSPAALAMFDRDMRYVAASDRWLHDYRLGAVEVVGKSHYEIFPEIGQDWKDIHQRCLRGATESCPRDPFPRSDGKLDWVRWEIKPWYTGEDQIGGIIMFTEVITDEVNAEVEISRSRNLARQIIDSSLDAVVAIDAKGRVTEWNPQAEKIFGYSTQEAVGSDLHALIVPDRFVESHLNGLHNYLESGISHVLNRLLQLTARDKSGREFQIEVSIGAIQVGDEQHFSAFIRDISERLKNESELTANRAQLKEAQRIAGLGFWDWDIETDEMQISEEKLRLYDRPNLKSPIHFETFLEIVHPDDRALILRDHELIAQGVNSIERQYRIVRPSGEIRYAFSQGEVVRNADGAVVRIFGTTLDVTERVNAELRLRSSEERLALAFEGSSDGFWDWNVVTGDCFFSPRIVEWLGYETQEFVHHVQFWEEHIDPDYLKQFNDSYEEHVRNRSTHYEIEERIRTKSGGWIWVLSRGKVVQWNEDGTPLRAAGTWTNITARKLMEARASQLGRILDHSMNEVYIIDPASLRIIEANHRAQANTGYSANEFQRMTIPDMLENWNESELRDFAVPLFSGTSEAVRGVSTHVRKDGTKYPFEATVQLMEWQDKTVFVSIGTDISEKQTAEHAFQELQMQLRHAQRLETIGTLAGGIAHDFNNILTPILGYADMAAGELEPESNARRDIEQVVQAAYRAKGLVQQILAFSRQNEQSRHALRLDTVVKETLRLLRASLPPSIEMTQSIEYVGNVLSDPTLINQILMNLCTNAYQAMNEDGGYITVTLQNQLVSSYDSTGKLNLPDGLYAKLTVADTGKGMEPGTAERIFEPFFTTKEVGMGTGLGLSVVHGIVQSHNGAIIVDSEPMRGTTICVYLPLLPSDEMPNVAVENHDCRGEEHLLLCDDDETILVIGKQMLESFGYKVTTTADPVAALAMLQSADPPVAAVIVDDKMPILSGVDVALGAYDYNPRIPVILLSASLPVHRDGPFAATLAKPVSARDLAKSVRNCIDYSFEENHK